MKHFKAESFVQGNELYASMSLWGHVVASGSKATADSSRLCDNSKVFVKSNSWQFQTWWQQ